jgi:hypothetical protein
MVKILTFFNNMSLSQGVKFVPRSELDPQEVKFAPRSELDPQR